MDELSNIYIKIAMIVGGKGDTSASDIYFQRALSFAPQNEFVYSRWGDSLYYKGQYSEAREKYAIAKKINKHFRYAQEQYEMANKMMTPARIIPHQTSQEA